MTLEVAENSVKTDQASPVLTAANVDFSEFGNIQTRCSSQSSGCEWLPDSNSLLAGLKEPQSAAERKSEEAPEVEQARLDQERNARNAQLEQEREDRESARHFNETFRNIGLGLIRRSNPEQVSAGGEVLRMFVRNNRP